MKNRNQYDVIIIGAGIVGLSIARALKIQNPDVHILVLEKEAELGLHASGRNSGVLHSGIYYPEHSLKAKLCAKGAKLMAEYCHEHGLPIQRLGKVIVPTNEKEDVVLDLLYQRAQTNGASASLIDEQQLKELEPNTRTASGRALHVPETSIVDSKAILKHLYETLTQQGVEFRFNVAWTNPERSEGVSRKIYDYKTLYNTAGSYADKIAQMFGVGHNYTLLPFKGLYYQLKQCPETECNGLIYPVPDMNVPFLGIHTAQSIDGTNYVGPTAIPALGREHYHGLAGVELVESLKIISELLTQYRINLQGFRTFANREALKFLKSHFLTSAQKLIPSIRKAHLIACNKVGIRPQLLNLETRELVMDFMVERKDNTVHVLNTISPAFTSSFAFAEYVTRDSLT